MKKTKIAPETVPTLKFKITNLRTSAFPGPLVKSDYLELQIGDYVTKGSENTIYEVTSLSRESFLQNDYDRIFKELHRYGNCRDNVLLKFIEIYNKSGNFGACWITLKPIIRGGKMIAKGRSVRINELDQSGSINYRGYQKADLPNIVRNRDRNITILDMQIGRLQTKKNIQVKARDVVRDFLLSKAITTKIEVRDINGIVVETIEAQQLV